MPVVTVIGGSNRPFSVPFSGQNSGRMGRAFERSMGRAFERSAVATRSDDSSSTATSADTVPGAVNSAGTITQSNGTFEYANNTSVNDSSAGRNNVHVGNNDTITGGVQDTISAAGNLQVNGGSGNHITVNGPLTFLGGSGDTVLQSENASIYGTGNSTYHYVGTNQGATQLYFNGEQPDSKGITHFDSKDTTGGGGHILFDASSSHNSLVANVGNGDTVQGGSASDTISVHNMNEHDAATLSGGSGAPNLFQFLNDKGGQYTITDFGSAAGNKVGISSSNMGNIQHILDSSTVSGGDTTISLDDQTKITFLHTTHLKPTDFHGF